jgi:aminopeptidase N
MITKDPHSYAEFTQGLITHIDFEIQVDFETKAMKILAKYQLDHPVSGSFYLDTRALDIERIVGDGTDIQWVLDKQDEILGNRLHLQDLDETSEFSIQLTTSPEASALQWLTPKQTAGGSHPFVYSQCQAIHARSIFPCQDSPSVRFTYSATVRVKRPLITVMGAERTGQEDQGKLTTFTFHMLQPIPSYLFAIAVGKLEFRDMGPRTGIYAEPTLIDAAVWEFEGNEERIIQAEKLLGPYLWDRYDLLIMPPSFPYAGMENPRLTFLSPTMSVGDRSWVSIITHELAHAWTGNLVTNATWEDFWINEGWTTYIESRLTEILEGDDLNQLYRFEGRIHLRDALEYYGMDSKYTCLKTSLVGEDPEEVGSYIAYYKGSDFLLSLENVIGRVTFDGFIKRYIQKFQFSSLSTEEFLHYLRQELPGIDNEVDIERWVYDVGFPEDAPVYHSKLYDQIHEALEAYKSGVLPEKSDVADWIGDQIFQFLRLIEAPISLSDCRHLEEIFGLVKHGDVAIRWAYYMIAIPSGDDRIRVDLDSFVKNVGRAILIELLFRQMVINDWTKEFARTLFDQSRDRHHPITVKAVESILSEAGL